MSASITIAPPDRQQELLSVHPIIRADSNAAARNAYGTAAQIIVCDRLKLSPIRINGNFDCCFDAFADGTYYEIKSVRHTGKVVLYRWRLEKESAAPVPLKYAILIHSLRNAREDILTLMRENFRCIAVIDAARIRELAARYPLNYPTPNNKKRHGYNREGYKDGYHNLPINDILRHHEAVIHQP